MRGLEQKQSSMLCLLSPADRVPGGHPLRQIKRLTDDALSQLSGTFDEMYAEFGRASIPPESLLKSSLLIALYSVRSERQFCEMLDYNLLFRWFLDMDMVVPSFDHSTFSKNRERLMNHEVANRFFRAVVNVARSAGLMSSDHFTVDGTLIEAWASIKSFKPKKENGGKHGGEDGDRGNPTVDFHGEKRSNKTHASTTDPEARLMRKGLNKEAKLSFGGHALMENRNGLLVDITITEATGYSEREAALAMVDAQTLPQRVTLGADAGYDTRDFIAACRERGMTPHVAPHRKGKSATDMRTRRHAGYGVSQRKRKLVEEIFGWMKTVGGARKTRYRGVKRTLMWAQITGAAFNLTRIVKLQAAAA